MQCLQHSVLASPIPMGDFTKGGISLRLIVNLYVIQYMVTLYTRDHKGCPEMFSQLKV